MKEANFIITYGGIMNSCAQKKKKKKQVKSMKGANFISCDMINVLGLCTSPHCPLTKCEVSFSSVY